MSERFVKRTDVDGWPIEDTETGDLLFTLDKSPLVELLNRQQEQLEQAQARIGEQNKLLEEVMDFANSNGWDSIASMLVDTIPDIETRAVEKAIDNVPPKHLQENDYIERLLEYARELRQKAGVDNYE